RGLIERWLHRRVEQVRVQEVDVEVRPPFLEPPLRQFRLGLADGAEREEVALDVVRLVDIRLDQRDAGDARVATKHVEDGQPATGTASAPPAGGGSASAGSGRVSREGQWGNWKPDGFRAGRRCAQA